MRFAGHLLTHVDPSRLATRNAQPLVTQTNLKNLIVVVPERVEEQRRIAEVLDTLDEVIQRTEALIAKLKQAKAGLLHDLLTRGLDENGELRDPNAHPEQFKETPLGRIPQVWSVGVLSELVPRAEYGISVSLEDRRGIPVLRMNNLKDGEADLSDLKLSDSVDAHQLLLQEGDVLFNRTNSIDHVGRTAIWRGQLEKASFASYLVRLVPYVIRLLPEYLNLWLNWPVTQVRIRRHATPGVHQVNINPTNLRKADIAFPGDIAEQQEIIKVVDSESEQIRLEESRLAKLYVLQKGLAQDILTGHVRTPTHGNLGKPVA